jgi:hypothetical protein
MDEPISDPFWDPIAQSALATFVSQSTWAYPAIETLHILGIALVFGPILIFDLRVLGFNRSLGVHALHRALLPWVWTGFTVNLLSGALLFIADAAALAANPAFRIKLALLALAGLNALLFQARLFPSVAAGEASGDRATRGAKLSSAASFGLWLAIITAGRLMAYVK